MSKFYEIAFALEAATAKFTNNFKKASKTVLELQDKFRTLQSSAKQAGVMAALRKETGELQRSYLRATQRVAELGRQISASANPSRQLQAEFSKVRAEAKRTAEAIKLKQDKLRSMAQAAGVAGTSLKQLVARENELKIAAEKTSQALAKQKAFDEKFGKARAGMNAHLPYAQQATDVVGGFGLNAIKTGMNFQATMSKVGAISGASAEDMARLTAQARQLGATTEWSASQAAEGMTYFAMAGYKTEQVMAAMPGMLNLATAGGLDLAQAADITANVMAGMGMKAEQAGIAADVLAKGASSGTTDVQMLGEGMKYAAGMAHTMGLDIYQTTAYLTQFATSGQKGSVGGTNLANMLGKMAGKQSDRGAAMLKKLNVQFMDAKGNLRDIPTVLKEMDASFKRLKLGGTQVADALKEIFGEQGMRAAAALMEAGDKVPALTDQLRNSQGSAAEMAKKMNDNLAGDVKTLASAWEDVQLEIFGDKEGFLRSFVQWVTMAVSKVGAWAKENPELVGTLVSIAGALVAFSAAVIPCVVAFRTLAFVFAAVKVAMMGAWAAMGPVGIILAAIAAAAYLIYSNWETVGPFLKMLFDDFCEAFSSLGEAIGMLCAEIGGKFVAAWQAILPVVQPILNFFAPAIAGLKVELQGIIDFVQGVFTGNWAQAWEGIKGIFAGAWQALVGLAKAPLNAIIALVNKVIGALNSISVDIPDWVPGYGGQKFGMNIPTVSPLAAGGIITEPTLAMVGEGGGPEAVLPLDRLSGMLRELSPAGAAGAGVQPMAVSNTFNVTVGSGSGDVYAEVRRGLDAGANDMARTLERLLQNQRRLSYA